MTIHDWETGRVEMSFDEYYRLLRDNARYKKVCRSCKAAHKQTRFWYEEAELNKSYKAVLKDLTK